jgi:hypothetical protein
MAKAKLGGKATWCMILGAGLVLLGIQLRAVETFELSHNATRLFAGYTGPPPGSPHGLLRSTAIDTLQHRHRITPPEWLGWTILSTGSVLLAYGALQR